MLNDSGPLGQMFQALTPAKREELGRISHLHTLKAGQVVIADGEEASHIGYIIDGILAMTKVLPGGRTHIIGLLNPTEIYGRIFDGPSSYQIEALTDARVLRFDKLPFERILLDVPEIERLFLVNVLDEMDAAREWILLLGGRKIIERVASFLVILSRHKVRKLGADQKNQNVPIAIHIAIRRIDLARYMGTRPESLSRAFRELEKCNILKRMDSNNFEILNLNALIKIVGHDLTTDGSKVAVNGGVC